MSSSHTHDPRLAPTIDASRRAARSTTRRLLAGGIVAGPLFLFVSGIQGSLRDGFDLSRHPLSALSVGRLGSVQVANFCVAGLLVLAGAVGLHQVVGQNRRGRWGTRAIGVHGLGLIAAGIFVTDAADGFPVGTPKGLPDSYSWHAVVHGIVTPIAFAAILVACVVLARPLGDRYGRRWRRSWLVPVGTAGVMAAPGLGGFSVRLALATALVLGWLSAVASRAFADA